MPIQTTAIITGDLAKVRRDLEDASDQLSTYWETTDTVTALNYVNSAAEALLRAVSTLTLVVARLAEPES